MLQFTTQKEDAALNATAQRLNLITTELQGKRHEDAHAADRRGLEQAAPVGAPTPRTPVESWCGSTWRAPARSWDKTIIEAIKDPLTHLVRNCCDHGIEDF
ncbi:MAG: hypothetical protein WDO73_23685 [Ignavibacteriota bacterium]